MLAQWLLAAMDNLSGFRVGDNFFVPVSCAINDSLQLHPLASFVVKVIASLAFYVGHSLALTFCFVAETSVEFESGLHTNIVVRVPTGKVFRMAVRSCLGGDKRSGLAGGADFWHGLDSHIVSLTDMREDTPLVTTSLKLSHCDASRGQGAFIPEWVKVFVQ